jgi:hypothetical protein
MPLSLARTKLRIMPQLLLGQIPPSRQPAARTMTLPEQIRMNALLNACEIQAKFR